ncbi:MAG: cell surface protein, partial [Muribaculaceae bacterium]|nr:cell surface protein [Muribaculaceae bacterium]
GGYIVVGFDHSIPATSLEYDFVIQGNPTETSNEPGIVWVMQDVNGNGLPDDEWYQLRGSEDQYRTTYRFYDITYFRTPLYSDIYWTTGRDTQGVVSYLPEFHNQLTYYPAWINADSYTLYGTYITPSRTLIDSSGILVNGAYPWGYADNLGSDTVEGYPSGCTGFKISNAMNSAKESVSLLYIDFIKVQTAILEENGSLGELSTEVLSFSQYSLPQ